MREKRADERPPDGDQKAKGSREASQDGGLEEGVPVEGTDIHPRILLFFDYT